MLLVVLAHHRHGRPKEQVGTPELLVVAQVGQLLPSAWPLRSQQHLAAAAVVVVVNRGPVEVVSVGLANEAAVAVAVVPVSMATHQVQVARAATESSSSRPTSDRHRH
jgi:hypothetical protein